MPTNEHPAETTPCDHPDEAIRQNLDGLLDLLAREVARRLPRQSEERPKRRRPASKRHPPSAP
jgi:hypothetical protein